MKTVPFNAEQAKAGRPTLLKYESMFDPVSVLHTIKHHSWIVADTGEAEIFNIADNSDLAHPADPCPGHNPAQLDEWTVGTHDGWRLLEGEEISARLACYELRPWNTKWHRWDDSPAEGSSRASTYRTRKPPGYFLPKVTTRNLRPEELPEVFLWRPNPEAPPAIGRQVNWPPIDIADGVRLGWLWSRSLDGPWNKFTVEEKQ